MCQLHISYKRIFGSLSKKLSFVAERIQSSIQCFKNNLGLDYTDCSCKIEHRYHSIYEVFKNIIGLIYCENLKNNHSVHSFSHFSINLFLPNILDE